MAAVGRIVSGTRHLSAEQRAYIAAKYLLPAEEEKARERYLATQNNDAGQAAMENFPGQTKTGTARDLAAAKVGLSGKTVDAAARAIEDGIPELEDAIRDGKVSATMASKISELHPTDQVVQLRIEFSCQSRSHYILDFLFICF